MVEINIKDIPVSLFTPIWIDLFLEKKDRCFFLYQKMRFHLQPSQRIAAEEGLAAGDPYTFITNGLCWSNVVVPIFLLNGEKLEGRFKVLTNNMPGKFHFVIYDSETATILDPTYEKFPDARYIDGSELQGTECTKRFLGDNCVYFDLGYYLRDFKLKDYHFTKWWTEIAE